MRMQSLWSSLILAGAAWLTACGPSPRQAAPAPPPVEATVFAAAYASVPDFVTAPGSVQPRTRIVLAAQINGFVREVRVRAGDGVQAGQLLATLDAREASSQKAAAAAAVEESRAAMDEARKAAATAVSMRDAARAAANLAAETFSRYEKLFAAKSVSPQELDEVRTRRDTSAAELAARETMVAAAQDRLRQAASRIAQAAAHEGRADVIVSWTEIKAPAPGRIAGRHVDPGAAIFPGSPLLTLESVVNPQVLADLPTEQIQVLRSGLEVRVGDASQSAAAVAGRITEINPVADPGSHTVQFKVDLPAGFSAPAGRYMTVSIPAGTRQALLVPRAAVRESGQLTGLFVVDGSSRARYRPVKIIAYDPERFEILSGLEAGDRVIAAADPSIVDGTSVEVRK